MDKLLQNRLERLDALSGFLKNISVALLVVGLLVIVADGTAWVGVLLVVMSLIVVGIVAYMHKLEFAIEQEAVRSRDASQKDFTDQTQSLRN